MTEEFQCLDYSYLRPTKQILDIPEKNSQELRNKNGRRIVYYNITPEPEEQEKIDDFLAKLKEIKITLPKWWTQGDSLRYLVTKKTIPDMVDRLIEHKEYISSLKDIVINDNMIKLLSEGYVYIGGRDKNYYPYIVANLKDYKVRQGNNQEDLLNTIKFVMAIIKKYMMLPFYIEKFHFILNVEKTGILDAKTFFPDILKVFGENNGFAGHTFIVNPGWTFRTGWSALSGLLPKNTRERTQLVKSKTEYAELLDFFDPDSLEKRYGGQLENHGLEHPSWPPRKMDDDFLTEKDVHDLKLDVFTIISQEEDQGYLFLRELNDYDNKLVINRIRNNEPAPSSIVIFFGNLIF